MYFAILTNSTVFLSDYNIKKYRNLMNQLIAKKKFGFKKKVDVKSPWISKSLEDYLQVQNPIYSIL
jgi:hypothetical protein